MHYMVVYLLNPEKVGGGFLGPCSSFGRKSALRSLLFWCREESDALRKSLS